MNVFELFSFLLAVFISVLFGKLFFAHIGWWGVLPAGVLGFGLVGVVLAALRKLPRSRPSIKGERK
jgi:hypothetical protein